MSQHHRTVRRRVASAAATAILVSVLTAMMPAPAQAAPAPATSTPAAHTVAATTTAHPAPRRVIRTPAQTRAAAAARFAAAAQARSLRIVTIARAQNHKPYRRGARGPKAFDCSGLTSYAYRKAGVTLHRTAHAQYRQARRIGASRARPGDLVFWVRGGHAYHVGVYAGGGKVWHAPKPGTGVKLAKIFDRDQVRFGRIGR
jgi:cell wall-associated NlpC family hydrolase